ncbi:MAG: hypothetical protein CEE42_05845 [Promethearchaeota archaeon Loki_b31]|nr:MAG: hypothetical protein CEE42_05845 [Candidatus Lokiarchaeota archaeon Loki_b31]
MNDLVLLSLIIVIFVRVIGLGISIDFLNGTKAEKFKFLTLGWVFWILGALTPIFSNLVENIYLKEFLLVLNAFLAALGTIFILWGFFKYFMTISFKKIASLIIIFIISTVLLFLITDYTVTITFCALFMNLILISTFVIPPIKIKSFKKFMGRSIIWYYASALILSIFFPVSIIIALQGYRYGLYNADDPVLIMFNYNPIIATSILIIILLVHLEYTTSSRKQLELKDNYSHDLGNILQVISSAFELIEMKGRSEAETSELGELLKDKLNEAAKQIRDIREL